MVCGSGSERRCWQKVSVELVFGQALSLFFSDLFVFVTLDKGNRLKAFDWPAVAMTHWIEFEKLAEFWYYNAPMSLFWVIFLMKVASFVTDLDRDLFWVLLGGRWSWWCDRWHPGLATWRAKIWSLVTIFCYYIVPAIHLLIYVLRRRAWAYINWLYMIFITRACAYIK